MTKGAPRTVVNSSSLVSGMSNKERFFTSRKLTSSMTCVRADTDSASGVETSLVSIGNFPCNYYLPVSQSNLPTLPGVPTAEPILVFLRYLTCSSSLKCLANSFAAPAPFSPCNVLFLSTRVAFATRKAAPVKKSRVGAPGDLVLCSNRVWSKGTTFSEGDYTG
jgi:hypothetical protein